MESLFTTITKPFILVHGTLEGLVTVKIDEKTRSMRRPVESRRLIGNTFCKCISLNYCKCNIIISLVGSDLNSATYEHSLDFPSTHPFSCRFVRAVYSCVNSKFTCYGRCQIKLLCTVTTQEDKFL